MTLTAVQKGPGALVIGCGNENRADDAAGLLVARRLRALGVEAQEASGEATALLETWKTASAGRQVIVIDATVTGAPPGFISLWDAHDAQTVRSSFSCSTHALGVGEAVELGRALGLLPAKLLIYGIEGVNFQAGDEPSPEVLRAVEQLAGRLAAEV